MFKSKSKAAAAEPTVVGRGAVVEGRIKASGRVQIDGHIDGTLEVEGHVSVGPSGKIIGEVIADDLAVGGTVEGKVTIRQHLHVVSSGAVRGEVRYDTLQVDRGAVLDGRTEHETETQVDPKKVDAKDKAKAPPAPPAPIGVG